MLNLSLNKLKVIAKIKGIKDYKSMSKESTGAKDYDVDRAKINKTIREIRRENYEADKILRDLYFTFDPEKDHYEPKKTVDAFNNNYIQYESIGDKDKTLTIKEYLDMIRPYLSNMINDHKTQGEWKIHLIIAIKFISSKDSTETHTMHTKHDNIQIMMGSETGDYY